LAVIWPGKASYYFTFIMEHKAVTRTLRQKRVPFFFLFLGRGPAKSPEFVSTLSDARFKVVQYLILFFQYIEHSRRSAVIPRIRALPQARFRKDLRDFLGIHRITICFFSKTC
jgi:hypothetical protein